jgi:cysteine desulfurase/selenocysteine lyase
MSSAAPAAEIGTGTDSIAAARRLFPGVEQLIYMDVAGRAPLCLPVRAALDGYFDAALTGGDKAAMFRTVEAARSRFARLINCDPEEVAITKNISEGLNIIATSLSWHSGDNLVVCEELEHANNVYVWRNLQRRMGVQIRNVPSRDGRYPLEGMMAAIDGRTRLLTCCTHTFTPGFRTDIDALGVACRQAGVLFVLDGAQSVGICAIDVTRSPVDALAVSTQKGLLGLYGMGFLYVRRAIAECMEPVYLARFGVDLGASGEAATSGGDYRLMPGAKRFDLGNYNFPAAAAVDASMALLDRLGVPTIEAHTRALAGRLARGLAELGLPVRGGAANAERDHIVSVGEPGTGHNASGDPRMQSLYEALSSQGVKLSIRKDMLRFSLHLYNNEDDVAGVLDIARRWPGR